MTNISFDRPYLLLLLIPLLLIVLVPFFIAVRRENRTKGTVISLIINILICVLVTIVAAGASYSRVMTETHVYVVADVSYSANKNLDTVDEYIKKIESNLPENSYMGVVAFGEDSKLVTELGQPFGTVKGSGVDDSATNLRGALTHTATLFGNSAIRRIVLITDAKETYGTYEGVISTIDAIEKAGVYIDAIYLDDNAKGDESEIQLMSVDFTPSTYKTHTTTADVLIQSSSDKQTNAYVELYRDGELHERQHAVLTRGFNVINFTLPTSEAGEYEYTVKIRAAKAENDSSAVNNTYEFTQKVNESIRVLLVSTKEEDLVRVRELYGEDAVINAYINDPVVPCTVDELIDTDVFILSDVDIRTLENHFAFINCVESLVSRYGKSLLTFGDLHLQNQTDTNFDTLKGMLPVNYGNSDQDPKLLCLVIDSSRSMQFMEKLIVTKQAAKKLVGIMNDKDFLIIITFSGNYSTVWPSSQIGGNREKIDKLIDSIEPTQGTVLGKGMQEAYDKVTQSSIEDKQVFLLSDGRTWANETDNAVEIAQSLYEQGIPTSVLNTFTKAKTGDDSSAVAEKLLEDIARAGRGNDDTVKNYYLPNSSEDIDQIVLTDIADDITDTVITGDIPLNLEIKSDLTMSGINSALPNIGGFIYARAKATATTVLTADYEKSSGTVIEAPVYAYAKYEKGRVASFTSSLSGEWVAAYADGVGESFFKNVLATATPKERHDVPFTLSLSDNGGKKLLTVLPHKLNFDATAKVSLTLPDGTKRSKALEFNAKGYSYEFDAHTPGTYLLSVSYTENEATMTASTHIYVPFEPEYDSFTTYSISDMYRIIRTKGTVHEDADFSLVNDEADVSRYTFYFALPLMIAAVILFTAGVIIRKLKWADIRSLFGMGEREKDKKGGGKR